VCPWEQKHWGVAREEADRQGELEIRTENAATKDAEDKGMCPWRIGGKQPFS